MAQQTGVSPGFPVSATRTGHCEAGKRCKQWKCDAVRGLGEIIPFPLYLFELPKQQEADALVLT